MNEQIGSNDEKQPLSQEDVAYPTFIICMVITAIYFIVMMAIGADHLRGVYGRVVVAVFLALTFAVLCALCWIIDLGSKNRRTAASPSERSPR